MKKILIIDDMTYRRNALATVLSNRPYYVFQARSGPESITLTQREKPDLILLDAMQGDHPNGFEVCRQLRTTEQKTYHPFVIMLIEPGQTLDIKQGEAVGIDDYLAKPLHLESLITKIEQVMSDDPNGGNPHPIN